MSSSYLVGGPLPWKVWIKHQAFAVKSFYLPLLQKKVHVLQLILLKTAGKSEMLGITSMDPTSSLLMHPSHLCPPQKNWRAFVSASGLQCRLNPKAKLWHLHASYINHEYLLKTSTTEMYITYQFIQWYEYSTANNVVMWREHHIYVFNLHKMRHLVTATTESQIKELMKRK